MKRLPTILLIVLLALPLACRKSSQSESIEIAHFPLDNAQGLRMTASMGIVSTDSGDGNGALMIEAKLPMTVELFVVEPEPVEKAILIYQAKMKASGLQGTAYLEMWCDFGAKGEYVTRGLNDAVGGDSGWKTVQTHYTPPPGKKLERVRLNLVINGQGKVLIDDLRLLKSEQ